MFDNLSSCNNQLSYLKSWKIMPLKCCTQYVSKFGKRSSDWKRSVFIPIPKKGNAKECAKYHQLCSFHTLERLCSKSFKLGFSSIWTENFQMYKQDLEKAEKQEIKLPRFNGSYRKQENSRKTSTFASLTMLKPLNVWITTNCGKFLKRWEYQTTLPVS